jgi:hypothetical protein
MDLINAAESNLIKTVLLTLASKVNSLFFNESKGYMSPIKVLLAILCNRTTIYLTNSPLFSLVRYFLGTSIFTSFETITYPFSRKNIPRVN